MIRLSYSCPSGIEKQFSTKSKTLLIGRNLPVRFDRLNLEDGQASGHHARLTFEKGEYWIEDLGSTNGTWVDGKRIKTKTKTRLAPGSTFLIGNTTLKLEPLAEALTSPSFSLVKPPPAEAPKESIEANASLPDLFLAGASLKAAQHRLLAIDKLTSALGEIDNLDSLASTLLEHLRRAFRHEGQSGHSGLLLGSDLILKAYRPEDQPPTCSLTLARHVWVQKKGCLWQIDVPGEVEKSASLFSSGVKSAMYTPLIWKGEVMGVLYLDATSSQSMFDLDDLRLMQIMATQAAMFIKNLSLQQAAQREALVRARLLAQFPRPIAERLARQPGRLAIASERVDPVTVLFSDVRGFTNFASAAEPEQVVQMLNDMFHDLTPIVLKFKGAVDKYIGDALLAVFGSPDPDQDQWEHAVRAALEMQAALRHLETKRWKGRPAFRVGIGIHTGSVIHGFIGAPERMEYTVIGSTINSASRYCDAAGPGEILISPATYARLHTCLEVEHPPREIETKHEGKIKAYLVRGWKGKKRI